MRSTVRMSVDDGRKLSSPAGTTAQFSSGVDNVGRGRSCDPRVTVTALLATTGGPKPSSRLP
jgi:hypothetical protein